MGKNIYSMSKFEYAHISIGEIKKVIDERNVKTFRHDKYILVAFVIQ